MTESPSESTPGADEPVAPHNPGEFRFGDAEGGEHNPGEPTFGEGGSGREAGAAGSGEPETAEER